MQAQNNISDKKKQQQNKESGITKMDAWRISNFSIVP